MSVFSVLALIEIAISFMAESRLLPKQREKQGWFFKIKEKIEPKVQNAKYENRTG